MNAADRFHIEAEPEHPLQELIDAKERAAAIMGALFTIFGMGDGVLTPSF